jgi:hypothetical protein
MTEVEKRVAAKPGLIEVVLVVDLQDSMPVMIEQFREAVFKQACEPYANSQFSNRFTHYCNGGLTMLQERTEFSRLIEAESRVVAGEEVTRASVAASVEACGEEGRKRFEEACKEWDRREALNAAKKRTETPLEEMQRIETERYLQSKDM